MKAIQRLADWKDPQSLGNRMRQRRFERFRGLMEGLPKPVRLLDVGGTAKYWELRGAAGDASIEITLLNLHSEESMHSNIRGCTGDATDMHEFADNEFDVVFSNSVIEHLFDWDSQSRMAKEVRRVGSAYWVQTPNYWFPIEPHFHVLGWQWMPREWRYRMIQRRQCGWRGPCPNREDAQRAVDEVRLLTRREMRSLFPDATLWGERMGGLVKSWVAYEGFDSELAD